MTRNEANKEILKILSDIIENNKSLRFWQILSLINPKNEDLFNEESEITLKKIRKIK